MFAFVLLQLALVSLSVSASSGDWDWCSGSNPCKCEDGWHSGPVSTWFVTTWWCYPCPAGTATMTLAGVGVYSCSTSPRNTWSGRGWGMPHACPAGYVSDAGSTTSDACKPCAANQFLSNVTLVCEACSKGTNSSAGSTACQVCPSGYGYDTTINNAGCAKCPLGQVSSNSSTVDPGICKSCADNYHSSDQVDSCLPCNAGLYSKAGFNEEGQPGCIGCPIGSVSTAPGQGCLQCLAGTFEQNVTYCQMCPPGFSSIDGDTSCSVRL